MTGIWLLIAFVTGCACGSFTIAAIMLALAVRRGDQLAANADAQTYRQAAGQ